MPQPYFAFKQFTIYHNHCAMKVNTDGCLLGAWASAKNPKTILDIGSGSGVVGLMLAQRYPTAQAHLVEIEPGCASQCEENARKSPFTGRIKAYNTSIQAFTDDAKYDLIVSNPPYFENNTLSPDEKRKQARHHTSLTLTELIREAESRLSAVGIFSVILPISRKDDFLALANAKGLFLREEVALRSLPNKPISRFLLAIGRTKTSLRSTEISIETSSGNYSETVQKWLAPFYLNL